MRILRGQVIKKSYGEGTNSEAISIYLRTDEMDHHIQIRGGNPFYDDVLEPLVGKYIACKGEYNSSQATFLIDLICVIDEDDLCEE